MFFLSFGVMNVSGHYFTSQYPNNSNLKLKWDGRWV